MSRTSSVVGALRTAHLLVEGEDGRARRAEGSAVELAVAAARLGLRVLFLCGVTEDVDADVRSPLTAEGLDLAALHVPSGNPAAAVREGGEWEDPLRMAARRDALVCTLDLPNAIVTAALREAGRGDTLRAVCVPSAVSTDPRILADCDVLVCELAAAAALVGGDEPGVTSRGFARRLGAYGPRKVVVIDRRGGASVYFDGERLAPVDLGAPPEGGDRGATYVTVFAAALVDALVHGDRSIHALGRAIAAASLPPDPSDPDFPGLPAGEALEGTLDPVEDGA
ncbi:MAG: hypothetical protein R3F34_02155 [Planctomycetota bacterium]